MWTTCSSRGVGWRILPALIRYLSCLRPEEDSVVFDASIVSERLDRFRVLGSISALLALNEARLVIVESEKSWIVLFVK